MRDAFECLWCFTSGVLIFFVETPHGWTAGWLTHLIHTLRCQTFLDLNLYAAALAGLDPFFTFSRLTVNEDQWKSPRPLCAVVLARCFRCVTTSWDEWCGIRCGTAGCLYQSMSEEELLEYGLGVLFWPMFWLLGGGFYGNPLKSFNFWGLFCLPIILGGVKPSSQSAVDIVHEIWSCLVFFQWNKLLYCCIALLCTMDWWKLTCVVIVKKTSSSGKMLFILHSFITRLEEWVYKCILYTVVGVSNLFIFTPTSKRLPFWLAHIIDTWIVVISIYSPFYDFGARQFQHQLRGPNRQQTGRFRWTDLLQCAALLGCPCIQMAVGTLLVDANGAAARSRTKPETELVVIPWYLEKCRHVLVQFTCL